MLSGMTANNIFRPVHLTVCHNGLFELWAGPKEIRLSRTLRTINFDESDPWYQGTMREVAVTTRRNISHQC